jgi:hypothetical protein
MNNTQISQCITSHNKRQLQEIAVGLNLPSRGTKYQLCQRIIHAITMNHSGGPTPVPRPTNRSGGPTPVPRPTNRSGGPTPVPRPTNRSGGPTPVPRPTNRSGIATRNSTINSVGGSTLRVLILCQRKPSGRGNTEWNHLAHGAYNIVKEYIKLMKNNRQFTVEYLVDNTPANHQLRLGENSSKSIDFVKNHQNRYDIVYFFTCPLLFMMTTYEAASETPLFFEHLKAITKNSTIFLNGNDERLISFQEHLAPFKQYKNRRFNFKLANKLIPSYTLPR